jgi:hypothetical protein
MPCVREPATQGRSPQAPGPNGCVTFRVCPRGHSIDVCQRCLSAEEGNNATTRAAAGRRSEQFYFLFASCPQRHHSVPSPGFERVLRGMVGLGADAPRGDLSHTPHQPPHRLPHFENRPQPRSQTEPGRRGELVIRSSSAVLNRVPLTGLSSTTDNDKLRNNGIKRDKDFS